MTPASLLTYYTRHKKNLGDVSSDLWLDWCNEINRFAYRVIYGTDPERFISEDTISVVAGDSTYALPATFLNMEPYGCGIFKTSNGDNTEVRLTRTFFGSADYGYYINGTTINLTPEPQATDTLKIRFVPTIATMTATSDILVIPDEFISYAKNAVDVLYNIWDENPGDEALSDQRFVRVFDEMARNIRKDTSVMGIDTMASYYY